jgi:hypothetical protein
MNSMLNWKPGKVAEPMLLVIAIRILEGIFVVGMAGCVLVFVLSGIDDLKVLFGRDHAPAVDTANSHPGVEPQSVALSHR